MSYIGNRNKDDFLGMPTGTASNRLRKMVLFHLLKKHGENICYRCLKPIETYDELSMEHKKPWLGVNISLFWDLNNITFSHLSCNSGTTRQSVKTKIEHGTHSGYSGRHNCRCVDCVKAHREYQRRHRNKGIR